MPSALVVAQEEVLGLGSRQIRNKSVSFLTGEHRQVIVPVVRDAMPVQELKEVTHFISYDLKEIFRGSGTNGIGFSFCRVADR